MCSTLFLYISLPFFCMTTMWNFQKLLSYMFYGGNVVLVVVTFFSLLLIFTLHWWSLAFLIFSPLLQNCHVVLPTKSVSLTWCLLSLFLCPSYSIFQICGYAINLSLILQTTWIQKQFPLSFSSLLTLLLSVLYKTWVAMRFRAKITSSCIWVAIPVN